MRASRIGTTGQSHANWKRFAVAAFAVATILSWFWFHRLPIPEVDGDQCSSPVSQVSAAVEAHEGSARLESDAASTTSLSAEAVPDREPVAAMAIAGSGNATGTLIVCARDTTTLGPLRSFRVRVANETRFADETRNGLTGELELPLTPGAYSVLVWSQGYEPVEFPQIDVAANQTVRIPTIELRAGSARIHGQVLGVDPANRLLNVELLGSGRHPCERCGDDADAATITDASARLQWIWNRESPCPVCGFSRDKSSQSVRCGDAFAFTNVSSGEYAVRLSDEHGATIGEAQRTLVDAGAVAGIVFDASQSRSVEIEMLDVDGRSLSDEWVRRQAAQAGGAEGDTIDWSDTGSIQFTFSIGEHGVAAATFVPPLPPHSSGMGTAPFGSRRLARANFQRRDRVDRAREKTDTLRPEPSRPWFSASSIPCEMNAHGSLVIGPLPTCRLQLHVTAGHSWGEVEIAEARENRAVVLHLHRE